MTLNEYKDKHKGERCFILGNSPSLKNEQLGLLTHEVVFICNRGYKAIDIGLPSFNYYVLSDANLYRDFSDELKDCVKCEKFVSSSVVKKCGIVDIDAVVFSRKSNLVMEEFPNNILEGWDRVLTVVLDAVIIAYHMGFKEIYLLGVDLNYNINQNNHFYNDSIKEIGRSHLIPRQIDKVLEVFRIITEYLKNKKIVFKNLSKDFMYKSIIETGRLEELA